MAAGVCVLSESTVRELRLVCGGGTEAKRGEQYPTPSRQNTGEIGMEKYKVAAKANPWHKDDASHDFSTPTYGLKPGLVKRQLRKSIEVLG